MKYVLICTMLLCGAASVRSQTLVVKDRATGRGLEHATVRSDGGAPVFTNAEGRVDVSVFSRDTSLRIELIGYKAATLRIADLRRSGYIVYLDETPFRMEEVIVSATRWKQAQRDVPSRIIAVREGEVLLQNPQTAADLLAASGEIFVQKSQQGGGSPMIRGFATNRVLIAVDGVRMNTAIFRTGNVQNVINLDPLATEKTEVLFGPGSVMYGSDAIGGVMSFSTLAARPGRDAGFTFSGDAVIRSSSANAEKTGHLDLLYGLPRWGFVSSITLSEYGDLVMGNDGPDAFLRPKYVARINGMDSVLVNADPKTQIPSGYRQINLMQKIRFIPADDWDLAYGFHYSTTSDYSRYDRLTRPRGSGLRSAEWYYGPQLWMMHAATLTHSSSNAAYNQMNATFAYQHFKESRHDRDFGKTTKYHRTETVDALSANLDFMKRLGEDHRLSYGAEYVRNIVGSRGEDEDISTGAMISGSTRYPDGATWDAMAAYANYMYSASGAISLQAGIRYSLVSLHAEFDTTFYMFPFTTADMRHGSLNGSIGAVYNPFESVTVNAVLSTGFRSPNVDDVGKVFDSSPGYVVVPNPGLTPEYAYNAELGLSKAFGEILKLDVTAFYTLLDDALVRRNYTLNGRDSIMYDGELSRVQAIQNAAQARVRGVQARLELRVPSLGLGLTSHLTAMDGDEELDDGSTGPLRHVAPWYGATHLTYSTPRLDADAYVLYNGEVSAADLAPALEGRDYLYALDADGNPYVPSWYTLNLKLRYLVTDFLQLTAGVENITDQRYRTYASGITAPGRNYIGALRLSF